MEKEALLKLIRALKATARSHAAQAARKGLVVPKTFTKNVSSTAKIDPKDIYRGFRSQAIREGGGPVSILTWLPQMGAEKLLGKKKVRKFMWKAVSEPSLKADIAAGSVLSKIPGIGKKFFTKTEMIPYGKGMQTEVTRPSALAPFEKVRDIAEPVLIGVGLEKGVNKIMDFKKQVDAARAQEQPSTKVAAESLTNPKFREKIASTMLSLHEENKGHRKRAHALKVLFKQAELGVEKLPYSYSELETKLAALQNQDLVVLEKALELAAGNIKVGELSMLSDNAGLSASEQFQAAVLGEEEF